MDNKTPGKDVSLEDLKTKLPLVADKSEYYDFEVNGVAFNDGTVPLFCGPNTVENERLIDDVAKFLSDIGVSFLRGGAFKPLSFPYRSKNYDEPGRSGLKWLKQAAQSHGMQVISEVVDVRELDFAADYIDMIQIGSRNMQNYPLLIEAARSGKAIMLKRHYGASLRDWLGAAEYILNEGNTRLVLCERGVSIPHTHRETSRFALDLQVVPAVKEITNLPIVCDPSHASFWAPWVPSLALASLAAGADGIMLEVHPDPRNAMVDPLQAIDFEEFADLKDRLAAMGSLLRRVIC